MKARIPDYHEITYEAAAETLVERYWQDDPSDIRTFSVLVEVLSEENKILKYKVTAYEHTTLKLLENKEFYDLYKDFIVFSAEEIHE